MCCFVFKCLYFNIFATGGHADYKISLQLTAFRQFIDQVYIYISIKMEHVLFLKDTSYCMLKILFFLVDIIYISYISRHN